MPADRLAGRRVAVTSILWGGGPILLRVTREVLIRNLRPNLSSPSRRGHFRAPLLHVRIVLKRRRHPSCQLENQFVQRGSGIQDLVGIASQGAWWLYTAGPWGSSPCGCLWNQLVAPGIRRTRRGVCSHARAPLLHVGIVVSCRRHPSCQLADQVIQRGSGIKVLAGITSQGGWRLYTAGPRGSGPCSCLRNRLVVPGISRTHRGVCSHVRAPLLHVGIAVGGRRHPSCQLADQVIQRGSRIEVLVRIVSQGSWRLYTAGPRGSSACGCLRNLLVVPAIRRTRRGVSSHVWAPLLHVRIAVSCRRHPSCQLADEVIQRGSGIQDLVGIASQGALRLHTAGPRGSSPCGWLRNLLVLPGISRTRRGVCSHVRAPLLHVRIAIDRRRHPSCQLANQFVQRGSGIEVLVRIVSQGAWQLHTAGPQGSRPCSCLRNRLVVPGIRRTRRGVCSHPLRRWLAQIIQEIIHVLQVLVKVVAWRL